MIEGVGKVMTKSLYETKSSPYKQVPFEACGLAAHCPFKHLYPESQGVPSKAPTVPFDAFTKQKNNRNYYNLKNITKDLILIFQEHVGSYLKCNKIRWIIFVSKKI